MLSVCTQPISKVFSTLLSLGKSMPKRLIVENHVNMNKKHTNTISKEKDNTKNKTSKPHLLAQSKSQPGGRKLSRSKKKFERLSYPTKSPSDKKEYSVIRLQNGLTALLIKDVTLTDDTVQSFKKACLDSESDPDSSEETSSFGSDSGGESDSSWEDVDQGKSYDEAPCNEKLAAASLCVGVGSFSDPPEIPGLAHFLEHMLFMGSAKYPSESSFDKFIKHHAGSDNASTALETTTFYFECSENALSRALDRFAQFFIAPLMCPGAMSREREAVTAEFDESRLSDSNRIQQLLNSLAQPGHPAAKFPWGDNRTLRDNVTDEQLHKALHQFWTRHYSAHRMTVVVQACFPLDQLEEMVVNTFSDIANNNLPPDDFTPYVGTTFNTQAFRSFYKVEPVSDSIKLELTWALPPYLDAYRTKPYEYVSHMLGHEGKGSLLSYLRQKIWALDLSAGCSPDDSEMNCMFTLFGVQIVLTKEGVNNLEQVLGAIFAYLHMLRSAGPCERVFQELKLLQETHFRYRDELDVCENVEELSENMHIFPPEDYITGPELVWKYDPEGIQKCVNCLLPTTVNIMLLKKGEHFDQVEPWFGAHYSVSEIPQDWVKAWQSIEPESSFFLPTPNTFLTTDFSLLPSEEKVTRFPEKIHSDVYGELWYRRDDTFKLPRASIGIHFLIPLIGESLKNVAMLDLYLSILKQQITEELYPASVAQLSASLERLATGVALQLHGFNQKLPSLLDMLLRYMKNFNTNLTPELFTAVKDERIRRCYNELLNPEQVNQDLRMSILLQFCATYMDLHRLLADVTLESLQTFTQSLLRELYVQTLVQGNMSMATAREVHSTVVNTLCYDAVPEDRLPCVTVHKLPPGEHYYRVLGFNCEDKNSCITKYFQAGPTDLKTSCILDLLSMMMEPLLFDSLRTKEQLGYDVRCTVRHTYGVLGFTVSVNAQADKHSADHVDSRIEAFLSSFQASLLSIRKREFETAKAALIKLKCQADDHLKDEVSRNWSEISSFDFMFDRRQREVECIDKLNLETLNTWFQDHVTDSTKPTVRKFSIQVVGHTEPPAPDSTSQEGPQEAKTLDSLRIITESSVKPQQQFIADPAEFKKRLEIYPPVVLKRQF